MSNTQQNLGRSTWTSPSSYVLVMIGAIVGLGNVFQFPFLVAHYGGLFILFYIIFELLVSVPLLLGELLIGHLGRQNPVGSISMVCLLSNKSQRYRYVGWFVFVVAFLSFSYYLVAVAFPLQYFLASANFLYTHGNPNVDAINIQGGIESNFYLLEISFLLLLLATLAVIVRGINRGLEGISRVTVPTYFIILLILAIYTCVTGSFTESVMDLFAKHPDQTILTIIFAAMSFAFFKLGVGMGTMIVYGSYLPFSVRLGRSTAIIVLFDAIISILSYFIIYPLMLDSNTTQFISNLTQYNIIHIFTHIPNGLVIALFFFLSAVIAAWTATIAMAETVAITLIEKFNISRLRATLILGFFVIILGTLAALTHTHWIDVMIYGDYPLRGILRNITSNILVPISAFLMALIIGWVLKEKIAESGFHFKKCWFSLWFFLSRYLVPLLILFVVVGTSIIQFIKLNI